MKRILTITALIAAAAMLAACSYPRKHDPEKLAPPNGGSNTIAIRDNEFIPAELTLEAGSEVTWVWDDGSIDHNVVGDSFASDIKSDGTFTHTFTESGTYEYLCTLHSSMTGVITVTEPSFVENPSGNADELFQPAL
ncbi:MAG: plastocyanin/azurin family copper-binding protein [Acidimicrobiia bacterium]